MSHQESLRLLYDALVASRTFYRAFSAEYLRDIETHGLNPAENPYSSMQREIVDFLHLLLWLDANTSFSHTQQWDDYRVHIPTIVRVLLDDLQTNRLELTPDFRRMQYYARVAENTGGAIPAAIVQATTAVLAQKTPLPSHWDWNRVQKLHAWARARGAFPIVYLQITGTCPALSSAIIIERDGRNAFPSVFGTFEKFQDVLHATEAQKILALIQDTNTFYLQITETIPRTEIVCASIS